MTVQIQERVAPTQNIGLLNQQQGAFATGAPQVSNPGQIQRSEAHV